jgi:hypothetical protein
MNARPVLKTVGASLLLAALLSSGVMPAQAAPGCTWPVQSINSGNNCPRPQLSITQAGYTVGDPVALSGSGFEPGEPVSIVDQGGIYNLSTTAAADGTFRLDWAVPNFQWGAGIMLSATGAASQYGTPGTQVVQTQAVINPGLGGMLYGWFPGEELIITVNDQPYPSSYASADGTSSTFLDVQASAGAVVKASGKQSGGFFSRTAFGNSSGAGRPPAAPAPEEVPAPVTPAPVITISEVPARVAAPAPVVKAPAPSRPQPQAAVDVAETGSAPLASELTVATLLAGAAVFLGIRRLRVKNNGQ